MSTRRVCNCLLVGLVLAQIIGGLWFVSQAHSFMKEISAKMEVYRSQ